MLTRIGFPYNRTWFMTRAAYSASSSLLNSTKPYPWCVCVTRSLGRCTFTIRPTCNINSHTKLSVTRSSMFPIYTVASLSCSLYFVSFLFSGNILRIHTNVLRPTSWTNFRSRSGVSRCRGVRFDSRMSANSRHRYRGVEEGIRCRGVGNEKCCEAREAGKLFVSKLSLGPNEAKFQCECLHS